MICKHVKVKKSFFQIIASHPMRSIAVTFMLVILTGSILLTLPISNIGPVTAYINHLFTATTAVCVTGLTTVVLQQQYSLFGQLVILGLIQVGGLSLISILAFTMVKFGEHFSLSEKSLLVEALNKDNMRDIPKFLNKVFKYTFFFEGLGALLYSFKFIPMYGWIQGIYFSIFHAVSSFCNAGLDIIGDTSFLIFQTDALVSLTTMGLIISGGLGFAVWWDLSRVYKPILFKVKKWHSSFSQLKTHSKIAIKMTIGLLTIGTFLIFAIEYTNAMTIGNNDFFGKLLASAFQSTTLRTAGYSTVVCGNLRAATQYIMLFLMFIGGSPGGTAGGIKTTTFYILTNLVFSQFKGKNELVVDNKSVSADLVRKSMVIFFVAATVLLTGILFLLVTESFSLMQLSFEAFSAFGTVGLTLGITSQLTVYGKITIILLMYIGRIGSVTMIMSFLRKYTTKKVEVHYPQANILVG